MRRRGVSASALALVVLATTLLYASVVAGMLRQWVGDTNSSHGLLLAAAAIFLVRRAWPSLVALPIAPRNIGFGIIGVALFVFLVGTLTGEIFVLRASLPLLLAGVVTTLWGLAHQRVLLAPLALFAIAIPLPAVLVSDLTLPLQLVASRVAAVTLSASGIAVVRDGNLLTLPNITLEVAEACSGLRSVISLVSVAAVCAAVIPLDRRRGAIAIAAAVPIAVIGNGFRVAATGVLATWFGDVAARGLVHDLTGVVAFILMCGVTFALLAFTRRSDLRWVRQHR